MKKIYHLASCTTCQRIIKELEGLKGFEMQNIKENNITAIQLDAIRQESGSYESLFSKKALKYRELGLHLKSLNEKDYRDLILQEYTFLKRPVIINGDNYYIGNAAKTIKAAQLDILTGNITDTAGKSDQS